MAATSPTRTPRPGPSGPASSSTGRPTRWPPGRAPRERGAAALGDRIAAATAAQEAADLAGTRRIRSPSPGLPRPGCCRSPGSGSRSGEAADPELVDSLVEAIAAAAPRRRRPPGLAAQHAHLGPPRGRRRVGAPRGPQRGGVGDRQRHRRPRRHRAPRSTVDASRCGAGTGSPSACPSPRRPWTTPIAPATCTSSSRPCSSPWPTSSRTARSTPSWRCSTGSASVPPPCARRCTTRTRTSCTRAGSSSPATTTRPDASPTRRWRAGCRPTAPAPRWPTPASCSAGPGTTTSSPSSSTSSGPRPLPTPTSRSGAWRSSDASSPPAAPRTRQPCSPSS